MTREFKPGDVAMVRINKTEQVAFRDRIGWITLPLHDVLADNLQTCEGVDYPARPLVVIDPESAEDVERFREIASRLADEVPYDECGDRPYTAAMQAALREFANPIPTRPDEPTGLGSVVEDAKGDQWVLINVTGSDMKPARQWRTVWGNRTWAEIDAVEVLSEGVPHE